MRKVTIAAVRVYQAAISPWLPGSCRYQPTCSEYAVVSVRRFGVPKGLWLAAVRLLRCHPLGSYGYDPVPGKPVPARVERVVSSRPSPLGERTLLGERKR